MRAPGFAMSSTTAGVQRSRWSTPAAEAASNVSATDRALVGDVSVRLETGPRVSPALMRKYGLQRHVHVHARRARR